ncbi:hypothetical protein AMD24_00828 [Candidatus Xiphinematobacter sp. Idaho Grape]|nr:hypothetical protein AMD24_00828 [Candidatus Xiphinematobacter sp. Idaho Grape]
MALVPIIAKVILSPVITLLTQGHLLPESDVS